MNDVTTTEKDTQPGSSTEKETTTEVKTEDKTVPYSRFQEKVNQFNDLQNKYADLEDKVNHLASQKTSADNPEIELAAEALIPVLQKKGFLTLQQKEQDDNAKRYAAQLKDLSAKHNGSDGLPVFDPYEISEFAKTTQIFDLEAAYERKYRKEIIDAEIKKAGGKVEAIETEKPSGKTTTRGEDSILTQEEIKKKLDGPGGRKWWEENREAILKAMEKGEIR